MVFNKNREEKEKEFKKTRLEILENLTDSDESDLDIYQYCAILHERLKAVKSQYISGDKSPENRARAKFVEEYSVLQTFFFFFFFFRKFEKI